jgi:hypothetical protein
VDCDALRGDQWERLKEFVPGGHNGKRWHPHALAAQRPIRRFSTSCPKYAGPGYLYRKADSKPITPRRVSRARE